jgi:hypothetical protein
MESYAFELGMSFPIRLENPHVIKDDQICCLVSRKGSNGISFNSNYKNRDSKEYQKELGEFVVKLSSVVPDGVLVFFPSYFVMNSVINNWKQIKMSSGSSIYQELEKKKKVFIEPKESSMLQRSMREYEEEIEKNSGALYFAVCRGKASEGIDFSHRNGRAVIITGLPFPPHNDLKIKLKINYLDALHKENNKNSLSGMEWYNQQASRAVNQAIGRVLRNRSDYGAIILADERFALESNKEKLSKWIQPHVKVSDNVENILKHLTKFFLQAETNYGKQINEIIPDEIKEKTESDYLVKIHSFKSNIKKNNSFSFSQNTESIAEEIINERIVPIPVEPNRTRNPIIPVSVPRQSPKKPIQKENQEAIIPVRTPIIPVEPNRIRNPIIPVSTPKQSPIKTTTIPTTTEVKKFKDVPVIESTPVKTQVRPNIETPKIIKSSSSSKNPSQFIAKAKNNLPTTEYELFKQLIFKFSKEEIKFDELMIQLKEIFATSGSMKHELLLGLKDILPNKYDEDFKKYLEPSFYFIFLIKREENIDT